MAAGVNKELTAETAAVLLEQIKSVAGDVRSASLLRDLAEAWALIAQHDPQDEPDSRMQAL